MSDSLRLPSFSTPFSRSLLPPPPPPSISFSFLPQSSPSSSSSLYPPFHHAHTCAFSKVHGRAFTALISGGASLEPDSSSSPLFVQLLPICDESHFDQAVSEKPAVILWMANWCRKCIYLKPKLEKLAAEFIPSMQFYCVDVNKVPHKLVARAGVTKMPTVQLWRDGTKEGEVVGGHKAHWFINEVRQMIDNQSEI